MGDIEAPPIKSGKRSKALVDDEYYSFMNNPNYKPPVETEPTPLRSDTYHSLMTRDVAEKVFARYERGRVFDPYHDRPMTELEKEILENPTLGTTPQREVIIKGADQEMMDYRQEEAFNLRRSRLFYLCFFTSMFGVVLMLYALSATVLFEKYDENPLAFYCSFVLFVPGMVWIIYVYLPCKQERERRKRMARARKLREHLKTVRQSYYYGHDDSDEEEFAQFDKQRAREERKNNRGSGSFKDGSRKSTKVASINTGSSAKAQGTVAANAAMGGGRVSLELPKAPARSSIKVAPSEKKASVQFRIEGSK
jgi:hypothetical protein